jgi:hypothetical protein
MDSWAFSITKDMFCILHSVRMIQTIFTTNQLVWRNPSAPSGKLWLVWILSARTSKASCAPVSSTKTHSSMDQSAPKFVNSCPVINSPKWIIFLSNCKQFHKCFYCHLPHLSGTHKLLRQRKGRITRFTDVNVVTYNSRF